jgi:hypothetical protein
MNFYLVGNTYIIVLFMLAILSNKYNKSDNNKDGFHLRVMTRLFSIILKYEIRVASDHAKSLCSVGSFNRVGLIIIPI